MANRRFTSQFLYSFEVMPVLLSCNFVVDSTNGNGFGIRSLKGPGIRSVYMHTSATPSANNPNPGAGIIRVHLQDNYSRYLAGFSGFVSPLSGSSVTSVTQHLTYIIVSLGTATLAQWQAKGLPAGVTPALGVAFIATATGTIGGSAAVQVPSVSGISTIEVVGDPNATIALSQSSTNGGGIIICQCLAPTVSTGAYVSPMVATAPTDGSVVGLSFYLSNSANTTQGE